MGVLKTFYDFLAQWLRAKLFGVKDEVKIKTSSGQSVDNKYSELAKSIYSDVIKNKEVNIKTFDPFTILTIISIIIQLVKCYMNKKKTTSEVLNMCKKPNMLERLLLRRFIRKAVNEKKDNIVFGANIPVFNDELYTQLLSKGRILTVVDIETLTAQFEETRKIVGE